MENIKIDDLKKRDFYSKENNFEKYKSVKSILIYGDKNKAVPFVSIIIPTFKRGPMLAQTITSILNQEDYDDYEIVIVDNEPIFDRETETEKIIKSFNSDKIFYYRNEKNIGMYSNWNRCMELARTKYVCMVHDDDALVKNHLKVMTGLIKKNPKIDYLACIHNNIDERVLGKVDLNDFSQSLELEKEEQILYKDYKDFNFGLATLFLGAIFNREKAMEIGGFAVDQSYVEDYFFIAKFSYYYNVYKYEKPLYLYRWAANQSLKSEIWQDQIIYEYYLSKYISSKRNIFIRWLCNIMCTYFLFEKIESFKDGTSFLKMKFNVDTKYVYRMCGIKDKDRSLWILNLVKKIDRYCRSARKKIFNVNKNITVLREG